MKKLSLLLCLILLLSGCGTATGPEDTNNTDTHLYASIEPMETVPSDTQILMRQMTLEEKVGQLFIVAATDDMSQAIKDYRLGGIVLFDRDFEDQTPASFVETLSLYQSQSTIPLFVAVDEEGGTVCRASAHKAFRSERFPSPQNVYATGGIEQLVQAELEKSEFLIRLGINVNFAPVCDITTDENAFMYKRSLGLDAQTTASCITSIVETMNASRIGSVLKHFPGYGNNTDTHIAAAVDDRTLEQLENCDLVPFQAGVNAGCGAIMVSHTIINALDPASPASLSLPVHQYLRDKMQFDGVIITDDLQMDAISAHYSDDEAAVQALLAGNDLLCTWSYETQYDAVLKAVQDGRISLQRIEDSVLRVLHWKQQLGLVR